ncbi:aldose 1-epimerase family protein [Confluentibacter sediminis]|uniref:aldose 1-epimerase family protein n=1 Tax=Confluentibacter sediminis TaxID=2219045 RepID=UPI000DACBF18|nr:aldose 1-epimerase family protein [Confluentibacter sediminis]
MQYTIKNSQLNIAIKKTGAELCSIQSVKNHTQFMWDADSSVWGNHAPNLFPIIGALKEDTYIFEGKAYNLPKHGFIRGNTDFEVHEHTETSLTLKLRYSDATLKTYPFKFEFYMTYKLTDNKLDIIHTVKNLDDKPLYFSVGGHPAFKCPVFEDENYDDYFLEFEHPENSKTHLINTYNGLISSNTKPIFNNTNILPLTHELFNDDALIFKDLKSKQVSLKSNKHGTILTVSYPDFEYLGIWAKPTGNYVCIEPWLGIADSEATDQEFITKEGILSLGAGDTFEVGYWVEVDVKLLS